MTEPREFAPGTFCWAELATSDQAAAKQFYHQLFGWDTSDSPIGEGHTYTMLRVRGKDVGGLYRQDPRQQAQGVPSHWLSYVSVESADDAAKKAAALGGTLTASPFDVMDIGRMAVVTDPTGATFALWQPRRHRGYGIVGEPGAVCWNELLTRDTAPAAHFYTNLFGWRTEVMSMPGGPYTLFINHDMQAGGMMKMPPHAGQAPPHWLVYFSVEDCDGRVAATRQLSGNALVPPTDVPGVGRFAVLQDPQGAVFGILRAAA
jgi:predicted enzyme related to lactoylglutathione lyase